MAPLDTLEGYALLPIEQLHESPLNPRKHFDKPALQELAGSIAAKGVLTPLLVRPNAKGFEIGAGHRRLRAAKMAGLGQLPCVVRQMSDADFLELIVVENDQREDVHPLEQAEGYKRLMLLDGYDAKRIADRIGRSEKFVYDRVKLLALTPLAQQLFLAGKMSAGHAILIARLTKEQQERIVGMNDDSYDERHLALFQSETSGEDLWDLTPAEQREERKKDPLARYKGYKPVSVRELDGWISEHVRFDPTKADPVLFPTVVAAVQEAPKPLVPITRNHYVQEQARDGKVRTYGPASWKRADGTATTGSKDHACSYSVGAVVVVGPGRGETFPVCLSTNREKCSVHWSKERAEAARNAKARARQTSGQGAAPKHDAAAQARKNQQEERERTIADRTDRQIAQLALSTVKWPLGRRELELIVDVMGDGFWVYGIRDVAPELVKKLHAPAKLKPAELAQAVVGLALGLLLDESTSFDLVEKAFKIDRKKIEKVIAAELDDQSADKAATATPKKKAAKK